MTKVTTNQQNTATTKQSSSQQKNKQTYSNIDEMFFLMRQAIVEPSAVTLQPDAVLSLQSRFGNRFTSQLVEQSMNSDARAPSTHHTDGSQTGVVQRVNKKTNKSLQVLYPAKPAPAPAPAPSPEEQKKAQHRQYQEWDVNRLGLVKGDKADHATSGTHQAYASYNALTKPISQFNKILKLILEAVTAGAQLAIEELISNLIDYTSELIELCSTISDSLGAIVPIVGSAVNIVVKFGMIIKSLYEMYKRAKHWYALHKASGKDSSEIVAKENKKDRKQREKAKNKRLLLANESTSLEDRMVDLGASNVAAGDAKVQEIASYGAKKVGRAFLRKMHNLFTYIGNVMADLVTLGGDIVSVVGGVPSLGISAVIGETVALCSRITGAVITLIRMLPKVGDKAKGLYKMAIGTRGKNRATNSKELVDLAYDGNPAAQQLLLDMGMFVSGTPLFKQIDQAVGGVKALGKNAALTGASKGAGLLGQDDMADSFDAKVLSSAERKQALQPVKKVEEVHPQLLVIEALGLRAGFEQSLAGKLKST